MTEHRGTALRTLVSGVVASLLLTSALLMAAPPDALAGNRLRVEGHATWILEAGDTAVRVSVELTLTNQAPDQVDDDGTVTSFVFDTLSVGVPREAVDVRAEAGGVPLDVVTATSDPPNGEGPPQLRALISLPERLFYRQTQQIVLYFDLPGSPPRSDSRVRVNPAYAAFDARAWGDPDLASVEIRIDDTFEVMTFGAEIEPRLRDGFAVYTATRITDPATWFLHVSARNDGALDMHPAQVEGLDVTILGWPGDVQWANEVRALVEAGLPYLRDRIGLPYDPVESVEILQARDPSLLGFAAWYLFELDRIELSEHVDAHVVLHELTHLWFNHRLFTERWVNEGMAEVFATDAVTGLGLEPDPDDQPVFPRPDDPGRLPLNEWVFPDLAPSRHEGVRQRERYGYGASAWVMATLASEIGIDGLAVVVGAAVRGETAYAVGGQPVERADETRTDWRRLLDLLEERAGSTVADGLFRSYVVSDADLELLDDRALARATYRELRVSMPAPWAIRRLMDAWDFAEATKAMSTAAEILDVLASTTDVAAALDMSAPRAPLLAYGRAATLEQLDAARAAATAMFEAAVLLIEAHEAVEAPRGFLEQIGLLGIDLDGRLASARSAFERSDSAGVTADATSVIDTVAGANDAGRIRVFWAGGAVLILVGAAFTAVVVARRGPKGQRVEGPKARGPEG